MLHRFQAALLAASSMITKLSADQFNHTGYSVLTASSIAIKLDDRIKNKRVLEVGCVFKNTDSSFS